MDKNYFQDLNIKELDSIKDIAMQAIRRGLEEKSNLSCHFKTRIENNLLTGYLLNDLKIFCSKSSCWSSLEGHKENEYLIYRCETHACVFKLRKTNPIDTQNIRNNLSNRSSNSINYIEHNIGAYLNSSNNKRLKDNLKDYKNNQIFFFHLGWSLSQQIVDIVQLVIIHTKGSSDEGLDWYLHLTSDTIREEKTNEPVNDDLVNTEDNIDKKAKIIKPKRSKNDQRKQSV
ncbi:hypothetical protein [Commensalibacter nepenthis]|uniref:Uncharacterized protein n=1 Tax=Commensalibacter nepenthis TaxID=3043872 RepID=A0ABT6Q6C9_9PROT|nr:hypothetical protein [Commensalibacter sp. TBRC 10068]MDI2111798.1 hypothetical protein [Commensalibacter sp. TBRC 10068]